jgi:hypothetical protein
MRKTKAPQIAGNNPKGHLSHAIARMRLDNAIVSQSPKKGKAQNDVLQLQYPMQEIRQVRLQGNPALLLQALRPHFL